VLVCAGIEKYFVAHFAHGSGPAVGSYNFQSKADVRFGIDVRQGGGDIKFCHLNLILSR